MGRAAAGAAYGDSPSAIYGLHASGIYFEPTPQPNAAVDLATEWMRDVYEVLNPKRTTRITCGWFALYPVRNPERASKRLRDRYYQAENVSRLNPPDRFPNYHSAVDSFMFHDGRSLSVIVGVVGPPHKGQFFSREDEERDKSWSMGVRITAVRDNERGVEELVSAIDEMMKESKADLYRVALSALPSVVD